MNFAYAIGGGPLLVQVLEENYGVKVDNYAAVDFMGMENIVNVMGGVITPECSNNWHITGNDWDEEMHQLAVELLSEGVLTIPTSEDGRTPNVMPITEEDVLNATKAEADAA